MCNFCFRQMTSYLEQLKTRICGSHASSDFNYVLQPCLCIFKAFGLLPLKLKNKNGDVLQAKWDMTASLATLAAFVCCIVGFFYGVQELIEHKIFLRMGEVSIISYITTWAQIFTLFALGTMALITSWTNMSRMRRLCGIILRIDDALRQFGDVNICYLQMRRRLFVKFSVALLVPVTLSMVNCTVIRPLAAYFSWGSPCYWFICFAPILLLTLKEFIFFNLMFVLKTKFVAVNELLRAFAGRNNLAAHHPRVRIVMRSVSEIPLTAVNESTKIQSFDTPTSVAQLSQLLDIYSNVADGVELLLQIFSWHLVLMTTASFVVITIQSYNLFALLVHSLELRTHQVIITIAWTFVQILVIGINVCACSGTAHTMAATGPLLHKLQSSTGKPEFFGLLQLFSLEVLHRRNNFTAAGFFNMDHKLITSIIAAVTTYLVIIIQFHLTNLPTTVAAPFNSTISCNSTVH